MPTSRSGGLCVHWSVCFIIKMSDTEDPYAVSSDSDDEDRTKPPPKINIEGRSNTDFQQIKQSLTSDQKNPVKDEKMQEEIEELRKAKAQSMAQMKKDFEAGKSSLKPDNEEVTETKPEKPSGLDKQTLSAFKEKFEKMDTTLEQNLEERMKGVDKSLEGVGKENMSSMKQMFETQPEGREFTTEQREEIENLKRSEAERKKLLAAFMEEEAKEPPRNCHICDKIVYPVERIIAAKQIYHNVCFKCCKCNKKLTPTTFNSHEGQLYCRAHYNEALHPERVGALVDADGEDEFERDDDEFALVSKPKQLASDVVRAGDTTNIGDELAQIRSLKEKKAELEQSAHDAQTGAHKTTAAEEIAAGKVREFREKYPSYCPNTIQTSEFRIATGGTTEDAEDENADERRKDLEAIRDSVHSVKNKWKTGDVEKAETRDFSTRNEIEELRRGPKVSDRFKEGAHDEAVIRGYDQSELDTSAAAEARRSFLEGSAFQSGPVERTATDLDEIKKGNLSSFKDKFEKGIADDEGEHEKTGIELDIQLKAIKESLEKLRDEENMTPEERADKKKKEIEEEFLRYKIARKLQEKRAQQGGEDQQEAEDRDTENKSRLDVEIKMAGKARERFKEIDAQNPGSVPLPNKNEARTSKWDKKEESTAEVVNRRVVDDQSDGEDEDAFDVKNLMNKFKNLQNAPSKIDKNLDELEALRIEAKNLRERFEKGQTDAEEMSEEKKRQLEEEFKYLKSERDRAKQELEAERAQTELEKEEKEEVQVAADHASKMAAKWEKIQKKEAKKAEKSKMPQKS
ncbi:LIM domain and actin-binding protein 1 [Aphelenchoides besseyi]|nr:LIM domain and actin-binding protein 1 [Aphelenchoides besseyi]